MNYVIIVAGGKGARMGAEVPKQFLSVGGKPILMHTINRFKALGDELRLIVVLPEEQHAYWKGLCMKHRFEANYLLAKGGETRFHSVKNGLELIDNEETGVVAVHDGVRPFVSEEVIHRCFETACQTKAAIPVVSVVETLRFIEGNEQSNTVPRDRYRLVQTPQTFDIGLLKRAYNRTYQPRFTDDAAVVEALGVRVTMVEGNRENIKITTPFDLNVAESIIKNEALVSNRSMKSRVSGTDK